MTGGTRVVAIESGNLVTEAGDEFLLTQETGGIDPEPDLSAGFSDPEPERQIAPRRWVQILLPTAAIVTCAAWTAFFVWARLPEILGGTTASGWTGLLTDWAMPVLLICVAWLLAMRSSRREALRFSDAARDLSFESERLESRLMIVNRELSLARDFIAAQSRDLESLGRVAAERLSQNAERLQELIAGNSERIDAIGDVSLAALENMEKLRGQLPVIANSAKDVTSNIANAGRTAHAQIEQMIAGFNRINEFGQASERQVDALRTKVDTALAGFEEQGRNLDETVGAGFAELDRRSGEFSETLESRQTDAIAALKARAAALEEELEQSRQKLDGDEAESLNSLRVRMTTLRDECQALSRSLRESELRAIETARDGLRLITEDAGRFEAGFAEKAAVFDGEMARRSSAQRELFDEVAARTSDLGTQFGAVSQQIGGLSKHVDTADARIAGQLVTLSRNLEESRTRLAGADGFLAGLTESSVRLLELIQASVQHGRDDLPKALATGEQTLIGLESRAAALKDAFGATSANGERLAGLVSGSHERVDALAQRITEIGTSLGQLGEVEASALGDLRASLDKIEAQNNRIAESARKELAAAIEALADSAQLAVSQLGDTGAKTVASLASDLGTQASAAIEKAMQQSTTETAGRFEQAALRAAEVGREAAIQLRDQLGKVDELAGNLERRVTQARERAEEQVDNDFARRAALVTEALNSNAIDITKALSADVADTAWAAYLRGDRGIFTRRAVKLIDAGDARAIAQLYEGDVGFREHVSRYVHDFEAILRQVLSARDGQSLGVTLLSSDMGKLYVALAQAIERLRN